MRKIYGRRVLLSLLFLMSAFGAVSVSVYADIYCYELYNTAGKSSPIILETSDIGAEEQSDQKINQEDAGNIEIGIVSQPISQSADIGENAVFFVEAEGEKLSFLWQRSKDDGVTWENASYTGYKTAQMKVTVKKYMYSYLFRCLITSQSPCLTRKIF